MTWSREWVLAIVILVTAGLCVHTMSPSDAQPGHRRLVDFPVHIAEWTGTEGGVELRQPQGVHVDDALMRHYSRAQGHPIELYVGSYTRMRQNATSQAPTPYLPGRGWYIVETGETRLDLPDHHGPAVLINRLLIQKGFEKQLVLYWYQARGRLMTSAYKAKLSMVWDVITQNRTEGTFVRISMPYSAHQAQAVLAEGKAFAEKLLPVLRMYMPS